MVSGEELEENPDGIFTLRTEVIYVLFFSC